MNITCHSSFETNLRIRVSTPNGQKAVDSKPEAIRGVRRVQQPSPPALATTPTTSAAPSPSVPDVNSDLYSTNYNSHYSQFSLPQQSPSFITTASFPTTAHHAFSTTPSPQGLTIMSQGTHDLDQHFHDQLAGTTPTAAWGSFNGFSYLDPALDQHHHLFHNSLDVQSSSAATTTKVPSMMEPAGPQAQMAFNAWMPDTATASPVPSTFISENAPAYSHYHQEGPKEWVPKRRRRNKRATSKEATAAAAAVEAVLPSNEDSDGGMVMMWDGSQFSHQEYHVGEMAGDGCCGTTPPPPSTGYGGVYEQ
ncbi:hypothetical protein QBC43DRAFT_317011 [Cladorrhinum sp. PSN259]|nr:hypothetical protein QBC43DRAFT_317011 [Cladorrhinum sp. PSN259]